QEAEDAITDAIDDAFEEEVDEDKADRPAPVGFEGDLPVTELRVEDVDAGTLRACLRTMMTSRRLDEKMLTLLKQGKGYFHIGSSGHEATQTALGRAFVGGHDAFCFYYRDLSTALSVGMTVEEILRAHFGKAADPNGGGRQMPEHFGHRELNVLSTSSSVGAQYLPAVGFALAHRRDAAAAEAAGEPALDTPKAVYVAGGEGSTSQGAFHEALNWAAREALPVVFHIQDNGYAISVPVSEQTAGGSIWSLLGGYTGLSRLRYDGTDLLASLAAAKAAVDHVRAGKGPVALLADVVRLLPHSSSDDHSKYREAHAVAADRLRDPIPALTLRLIEAGIVTADEVEAMRVEIHTQVDLAARAVEAEADPDPATATKHVYYEGPDDREYEVEGETGELVVLVDAINHALDEELARDPRVLLFGEDVGGGKGGVFTATRGLAQKYGKSRVFNSPLAEASIIGAATGLAAAGYMPVVEIQFADYVWPGMDAIRNQVASMRYRSNNAWEAPMVMRMPCGGYIHGGLCHSQNVEAMFAHFPGVHVVMPSNAADAKGLLKTAIRGRDPVIFLEHKSLYRQGPARSPEPGPDFLVPLGKARVVKEGTDLTIVTWGAIVYRSLAVARTLEKEGVSVEVIDIRSMLPLDTETILASACKTGRVLVAYEDHEFMGFGAEIAAQVADAAFGHLDAPVRRVAGA
ncbi:MAG TPA: dehydrogenase E1 component subunit alpha/beta, partial [Rubricoccaceae bacterium]